MGITKDELVATRVACATAAGRNTTRSMNMHLRSINSLLETPTSEASTEVDTHFFACVKLLTDYRRDYADVLNPDPKGIDAKFINENKTLKWALYYRVKENQELEEALRGAYKRSKEAKVCREVLNRMKSTMREVGIKKDPKWKRRLDRVSRVLRLTRK